MAYINEGEGDNLARALLFIGGIFIMVIGATFFFIPLVLLGIGLQITPFFMKKEIHYYCSECGSKVGTNRANVCPICEVRFGESVEEDEEDEEDFTGVPIHSWDESSAPKQSASEQNFYIGRRCFSDEKYEEAYAWLKNATQGDDDFAQLAEETIEELIKHMTAEQIREGQRLAEKYAEQFLNT